MPQRYSDTEAVWGRLVAMEARGTHPASQQSTCCHPSWLTPRYRSRTRSCPSPASRGIARDDRGSLAVVVAESRQDGGSDAVPLPAGVEGNRQDDGPDGSADVA